ncbi:MAG TPA: pilus assembly protein [Telluria sp.]|jgi:type IV pilus assembly protein PilX
MNHLAPFIHLQRQRGSALVLTMGIMLALMIVGVAAMQTAINAEKSARGERDHLVALQAAEAALLDAERDIDGAAGPGSPRAALFAAGTSALFVDGCGSGVANPALGLCARALPPAAPAWQRAQLDQGDAGEARFVEYGRFTAAIMSVGSGMLPARLPRYIIEQIPYVRAGGSASTEGALFYRITAIGFGANAAHSVVLQSYYFKPLDDGGSA